MINTFSFSLFIYCNGDVMTDRFHFFMNDKFRMTLFENSLYVANYEKILILEEEKILFLVQDKKIMIQGTNLLLKRMLQEEMLIEGNIKKIEVNHV